MNNFCKYIPFSFHIIHMIIFNNSILSHHFHREYPVPNRTLTVDINDTFIPPPHLKHLPKRPFTNNPHNLKVPRPNLTIQFPFFFNFNFRFISFFGFIFSGAIGIKLGVEREGFGTGVTRRRAYEGVGPIMDDWGVTNEQVMMRRVWVG
ncbi:hypothetical protein HanRHA438_Chr09g0421961 [Helianthus annuus]|nr:hypothetical protein HanRHA438_Chr09g0421961 [Helianthus annuus]